MRRLAGCLRRARRGLAGVACALLLGLGAGPLAAWDAVRLQAAADRLGPGAQQAVAPLQQLLVSARRQDDAQRLQAVNQFYNLRIDFRPDAEIWGVDDHWASPLQTLAQGRGDCEDFVIAKYATLLAAGVRPERLRLVYVRARLADVQQPVPHMVLAYYGAPGTEPLILDNLRPEVMSASHRPDLQPVFSFNAEGLWQGVGPAAAGDPMARLSRWRDVWARTRAEGFP